MSQISRLRDSEISNGNLINADDIDAELNQLVSESNSQDSRLTNIESSAMTIAGVKTFSAAPKTDQIDERTLDAGVSIDSVLHKDGTIQVLPTASFTPSANGQLGYDSTSQTYKVMENGIAKTLNTAIQTVSNLTAAYTATVTNKGTLFACNGTFILSLTAAATLLGTWYCQIRNDGTGIITIDPNGSETIDGQLTITVYPGEAFMIVCDGSNFKTVGRQREGILLQTQTVSSSVSVVDFASYINGDFAKYKIRGDGIVPANAGDTLWARVSTDGGLTYKAGASDYAYAGNAGYSNATAAALGNGADNKIPLSRDTSKNTAANAMWVEIEIINPASTTSYKTIKYRSGATRNSDGLYVYTDGSGQYLATTAINAARLLFSTGNIVAGTFYLIGERK